MVPRIFGILLVLNFLQIFYPQDSVVSAQGLITNYKGPGPYVRISNGQTVSNIPYQIQLLYNGKFHCSGAILSQRWVMTAAHCFAVGNTGYQVLAGTNRWLDTYGGKLYGVEKVIQYPYYEPGTSLHDIGMLKVDRPFAFSARIRSVPINGNPNLQIGTRTKIAGWGAVSQYVHESRTLLETSMQISDYYVCQLYWGSLVTTDQLCAVGVSRFSSPCGGDSGGPLTKDGVVVGIVSFGSSACPEEPGRPDVFTKVSSYVKWIQQIMSRD